MPDMLPAVLMGRMVVVQCCMVVQYIKHCVAATAQLTHLRCHLSVRQVHSCRQTDLSTQKDVRQLASIQQTTTGGEAVL